MGKRTINFLRQAKIPVSIGAMKIILQKKEDGKEITPRQAKQYNEMADNILEVIMEEQQLYNLVRNKLKQRYSLLSRALGG